MCSEKYMHKKPVKKLYEQLTKHSLEDAVDALWNNILPKYFDDEQYSIVQNARPWPGSTKTRADFIIRQVRQDDTERQVVLIENKRAEQESRDSTWRDALGQLEGYMKTARAADYVDSAGRYDMFGIVTVGRYSRFYVLHAKSESLVDYGQIGGQPLEFKKDEDMIDYMLLELVRETSAA
ncbi:hypothetical protein QQS21_008736 [Conoideocrella luteorostrata]|uniref:Uncharacterized protein n=1 Tax=Conoideocrella luteorostrata TaxID=1105319 RepID=A0AAJ0FQX7_9HYPO|nr:hypothetical protein QQS21_008736 [Conoideocrella luteorostrata]